MKIIRSSPDLMLELHTTSLEFHSKISDLAPGNAVWTDVKELLDDALLQVMRRFDRALKQANADGPSVHPILDAEP